MKKTLKLIPAIVMLLVSAILVSTSTYAWFSMNTQVTAENMVVTAVAEKGLLINEVATATDGNWDESATANQTSNVSSLYPTSTSDGSTWYHANSKKLTDAAGATSKTKSENLIGNYETLSGLDAITAQSSAATAGSQAAFSTMGASETATVGYYVHYTYYLKGTSTTDMTLGTNTNDMNVFIKNVAAVSTEATPTSAELNKSLRVGIRMKSSGIFYIYAPIDGATSSYYVAAAEEATTATPGSTETKTDLTSLPAASAAGTPVEVYIWYEGEDANCKSANIAATLDSLKVTITFELKSVT